MAFGTHQTSDTLAAYLRSQNLSVAEFGEGNAYAAISEMLSAHNAIMREVRSTFCMDTTERLEVAGAVSTVVMEDADEFTTPDAQKITAGAHMGYPMFLAEAAVQWTRKYLQNARISDIQATVDAVMTADDRRVTRDIRRSFMLATNYTSIDKLVDRMSLPVKRLYNADSFPIPPDPWGNTFNAATHTHYIARVSTLAATDIQAVINTVVEHNVNANMRLYINPASEAAVRGFTSNFTGYVDARIVQANSTTYAQGSLNMTSTQDRAIGVFDSAEVWVKPWVPANYMVAHDITKKPCKFRHRVGGSGDLEMVADDEAYPLRAKVWEREFGVGVSDRSAVAMLYTGATTWADPTIT